jgi:RHS repeat-associated protein
MAGYFISEPWLNLWLEDVPMSYMPAYGDPVELRLTYTFRRQGSAVGGAFWHGAQFGDTSGFQGVWGCSWLSFGELSAGDATVDLMLPAGGWATFNFPTGSNLSTNNFLHNLVLEKQGPAGGITNLVLHLADGSTSSYGVYDKSDSSYNGIFYLTSAANRAGNATTFTYNANYYLTTVTAVDGTTFTLHFGDASNPSYVTSVTASYDASVSMAYDPSTLLLTNITDAAGLSSQFVYASDGGIYTLPVAMLTPYGTTQFDTLNVGSFDRVVWVTNAVGTIELYAQLNSYGGTDWPDFATSQVPTNTPLGTLDTDPGVGHRQERNTFYWNAQQLAPFVAIPLSQFTWTNQLKDARIRHWLASADDVYTHWLALSAEQAPSPDGVAEGEITFYDYIGKPSGVDYEVGVQVMPSVIARVMPDASTWYQYFTRLTNGLPTSVTEVWMGSGTVHSRTNVFVYAANNIDLVAWTNALGVRAVSNVYNAYHEVVTSYDALGQVTTNGYDATTHQITSSLAPSGLATLYSYNGSHRLLSVVDLPINRTNSYTWNSDGSLATSTDPRGLVETYFWDGLHRLTGTSDSRGTTTNLYYILSGTPLPNSSGGTAILDLTRSKDRLGNWTSYVYDGIQRRITETNANGVVTAYSYCDCGSVKSVTNAWNTPVQQVTTYNFDNQGRLTYTAYGDSYNFTNWYDSLSRLIATADGAATNWLFYDNLGRHTVRSNAYGAEFTQTFDLADRPVNVTDANGLTITNTYDNLHRLLTRGYPDTGVERFSYTARGLTNYVNQISKTNWYVLDAASRKTAETNANGEIIQYSYDASGSLTNLIDGKGQSTKWTYDQYGRTTNKLDQTGTVILKYTYDADDRLLSRWSAAKATTYYTNDAVGNLTAINYPSSTDVIMAYDSLNRLTNMVDASGTTKYTYTAGNQLLTEDGPFASDTVTNTYANRLRTALALQQPSGIWTNGFKYDAAQRLTNVTSQAGSFGYVLGGTGPASPLIKRIALPNTSYITNAYDNVARLNGTWLKNSGNTALDSATYGYNTANQRTTFTNAAGTNVSYTYDSIGQLKAADSSLNTEDRGYVYDAAWNLGTRTNNGVTTSFTVDTKNELTNIAGASYSCDGNGNLTWGYNFHTNYVYDDENRLVQWFSYSAGQQPVSGDLRTDFVYDGLSRLRSRSEYQYVGTGWLLSGTTYYVYDGTRVIQERTSFPTVSYTRGPDLSGTFEGAGGIGGLLARSTGYSGGWTNHWFYHADGNGNITYLADASQTSAASYRYDPFGNITSSSGSQAGANTYRFSSKEIHLNSGLYYYGYRFYDPNSQRWVNRDPVGEWGGINLYEPTLNDPTGFVDDCGRAPRPVAPPAGPPPVPVPGAPPGVKWVPGPPPGPGERQIWIPDGPVPGRSPPSGSWDPDGHWDIDTGLGTRWRFTWRGNFIPEVRAHNPGRPPTPRNNPRSPRGGGRAGGLLLWLLGGFGFDDDLLYPEPPADKLSC